ncbi:MAG TPA: aldo/keto reductase [Candidatus Dormibacteraeota bacterium]|nr:aldo/keto reductase [Candidatus Dormibacteraeota bacterium]HEV2477121.1 aldo/keto reductase [Candidatus Dormibacteraeota bacterium]
MRYVEAGGVRVSVIGLGTWQFGSREWGYGRDYAGGEAVKIAHRALELGINLIDTAEIYGPWRSERIVGQALQGRRDDAFIATKIFPIGLPFTTGWRARASARRLRTGAIDLYQLHWPSVLFPPRATMPRFRRLMDGGLVRHVGVSNHDLRQWRECDDALGGPVLSNQVRFSLVHREPERELLPWAQGNDRIVIAYSPLAQGVLSGQYRDRAPSNFRRFNSDFSAQARQRHEPLSQALVEIAARHDATPAQVALAWLVSKPNVVAIPGASSVKQLEDNARAGDMNLAGDEIAELDRLSA